MLTHNSSKRLFIGLALWLILFAAACNSRATSAPTVVVAPTQMSEATAAPTMVVPTKTSEATVISSPVLTLEPQTGSVDATQPAVTPTPTPSAEAILPEADAIEAARQALAERLGVAATVIELTSLEPIVGAAACLGTYQEVGGCSRAVFQFEDQVFTYHLNQAGMAVEIAGSARPRPGGMVLTWGASGCGVADLTQNETQILVGPCGSQFTAYPLSSETPQATAEMADFIQEFAPFAAWTSAGYLDFAGLGSAEAPPAEQQKIAEWLAEVADAAVAQHVNAVTNQEQGWLRVQVPELALSFETPLSWSRRGVEWVWIAPPDGGSIGLFWASGQTEPASLLPDTAQTLATKPVDLGWVSGTSHTIEISENSTVTAVETHVLLPTEDRVFDFFASAPTSAKLVVLQPVLERMLSGIAFGDEAVGLRGPVQIAVDFFSAWLRDEAGTDGAVYLSQSRQAEIEAGRTIGEVLGIRPGYRTFAVTWISTGNGRSELMATLAYAEGQQSYHIILIEEDSVWRVDSVNAGN